MSDLPNLVLAVVDTTRADHLKPSPGRPGVSDLAARGTVFHHAVSPAPWTLPAHGSLFTGLLPYEHALTGEMAVVDGHVRPVASRVEELANRWLPALLKRAGYDTLAVSANPWITPRMGWGLGFDRFLENWEAVRTPRFQVGGTAQRRPRTRWLPGPLARAVRAAASSARAVSAGRDSGAIRAVETVREWLATRDTGRPYFAFLNFMEAHLPYLPPRPHAPRSPWSRLRAASVNLRLTNEFVVRYNVRQEELSDEDLLFLRQLYAAEVGYLDRRLADLASEVDSGGRPTVLVVVGDHGENLGENHFLGHQASLAENLLHVPLIVSGPKELAGSSEVEEAVSTAWLWGSLLRLAGLEAPSPELLHSRPSEPPLAWYESAYTEAAGARKLADGPLQNDPVAQKILRTGGWAAYRGRHKLVVGSDGSRRLFDPAADPGEQHDLAPERPELMSSFADLSLPFTPAPWSEKGYATEELEEIERHLESLGYL